MGGGSGEGGKKAVVLSGHTKKWCLIHFAVKLLKGVLPKAVIQLYLISNTDISGFIYLQKVYFHECGRGREAKDRGVPKPCKVLKKKKGQSTSILVSVLVALQQESMLDVLKHLLYKQ